jgi:hypothetical protein
VPTILNAACSRALDGAGFDLDAVAAEVLDCLHGRAGPLEAEVAVSGPDGLAGDEVAGVRARPVGVQTLVAEGVREPARPQLDELGSQHVAVEGVRALGTPRRR